MAVVLRYVSLLIYPINKIEEEHRILTYNGGMFSLPQFHSNLNPSIKMCVCVRACVRVCLSVCLSACVCVSVFIWILVSWLYLEIYFLHRI